MTTLDRQPTWLSSGLAVVLAAAVALLTGFAVGQPVLTLVGLAGAAGVVGTVRTLATDRSEVPNGERAGATLGFVLSVGILLAPTRWLGFGEILVMYLPLLGAIFVGLAGAEVISGEHTDAVFSVCWRTRDVFVLGAVVLGAIQTGAVVTLLVDSPQAFLRVTQHSAVAAILLLQGLTYAVVLMLPMAQRELDERVGTTGAERVATITVGGKPVEQSLRQSKSWIHAHAGPLIIQAVLVLVTGSFLERSLMSVGAPGVGLLAALQSGVLHAPLLVLVLLAAFVLLGSFVHEIVTTRVWIDPPAMATDAVGGTIAALVIGVVSLTIPEAMAGAVFPDSITTTFYGPGALLLGTLAVLFFGVPIVVVLAWSGAALTGLASERSSGFLIGAIAVLLGSIVAAELGLPAVVVFVSVAVAVLVWDLGEQASYLGMMVGTDGVSDDVETVHATAAIGVGIAGVAIASGFGYLLGPLVIGTDQALAAIVLALLAAVMVAVTAEEA